MSRFWFWLQPAIAVVLLGFVIYTLVAFVAPDFQGSYVSIHFVIQGAFVFPGLILSLGVNQAILWFRKPRTITRTEKIVLSVLVGLIALFVALSFIEDAIGIFFYAWPVLVVYAIVVTIVLAVTSSRLRGPEAVADDDRMDELFASGEH